MTDPYEQAEDELVRQYNAGEISDADFRYEMRSMRDEQMAEAEEAAAAAYEEVMGPW